GVALAGGWAVTDPQTATTADLLGTAAPHSDTTAELVGNTGTALLVLGLCLVATRSTVLRAALLPVAATGALALTTYSVHIVAVAVIGNAVVWQATTTGLLWFVVVTLVLTTVW